MAKIQVDKAENESGIIDLLRATEGLEVSVMALPCGDYVLSPEFAVERKSASDFAGSIMSGRIFEQVARMKLSYKCPVVLIEGDRRKTYSGIKPQAVSAAISSLMAIQRISVVTTTDKAETAYVLATMARHLQEGLGYEINLHPEKPKPNDEAARYVISSLPGIGAGNAKKLFDHFGSIFNTMNASPEDIMKIKGIGPKIALRIYDLIHFGDMPIVEEEAYEA